MSQRRVSVQNCVKTGINLQNIQSTKKFKVPNYTNNPRGNGGNIIFNTSDKQFYGNNGTTWNALGIGITGNATPNSIATWQGTGTLNGDIPVTIDKITGRISNVGQPIDDNDAVRYIDILNIGGEIPLLPEHGGTGVINNPSYLITLGGSITTAGQLTTTGSNSLNFATTANTNVTLPSTGTLATLNGNEILTNKTLTSNTNTISAKNLFYDNSAGSIDINTAGYQPSAGTVLAALSASSARWMPLASSGSVSMVYVKPAEFGGGTPATQTTTSPTEFTSIVDAINYINGLSATPDYENRYVIYIYPGLYSETYQIVVPSYVYLVGDNMQSVRIQPLSNPVNGIGYDFMTFAPNSGASFLTVQNVDVNVPIINASNAIRCTDSDNYVLFHKIEIENCQKAILCDTTAGGPVTGSLVYFEFVDTSFGASVYSLKCTSTGGTKLDVSLDSFYTYDPALDVFIVDGPDCSLIMAGTTVQDGDNTGNCVTVTNGGHLNCRGLYVNNFGTVVNAPDDGGSPDVVIEGAVMDSCTLELQILNPNTSGHFSGYTNYLKTFINPSADFFITNQDSRVVTVAKQGGNFNTVSEALTAITTSSSTNRYVILVGPGVYDETALDFTGKSGISLMGYYQTSVTLRYKTPNITSNAFITASGDTVLNNLTIEVIPTVNNVNISVKYGGGSSGQNLRVYNCVFKGGDIVNDLAINRVIDCQSSGVVGQSIVLLMLNNIFNPSMYFATGIYLQDTANVTNSINYSIDNLLWGRAIPVSGFPASYSTTFQNVLYIESLSGLSQHVAGSIINAQLGANVGINVGNCIQILGNTNTIIQNCIISGFDTGLYLPNTAGVQKLTFIDTVVQDSTTYDLNVLSTSVVGNIAANAIRSKVNIVSTDIAVQIIDASTGSITIGGDIYQGFSYTSSTNISNGIHRGGSLGPFGTLTDILLTQSGALTLNIPSGSGYVTNGINGNPEVLTYVEWNANAAFPVPTTQNTYWIYIDSTGAIMYSISKPSCIEHIILGAVRVDNNTISYINQIPQMASHTSTKLDNALRKTFENLFQSVCAITPLSNLELAVSSGTYSYSLIEYSWSGDAITPITFLPYYYNSGTSTWTLGASQTAVPAFWNDTAAGTLVALSLDVVKHALYVVVNNSVPTYLLVYGQETFANVSDAITGALPPTPVFIQNTNVVLIAGIIISFDDGPTSTLPTNQILNECPTLSFSAAAVNTTLDHNSLLNLTVGNFHPQYLLIDGSSAMSGDLNMDNNNVINGGTYNNVTVQAHASRHLPSGSDPLPVGDAQDVVATVSSPGIAESFSRSDHRHFHGLLNAVDGSSNPLHSLASGSGPGFMSSAQYTLLNNATDLATASTLVLRDVNAASAFRTVRIDNGTRTLTLAAPALSANYTMNLPSTNGSNGYILTTDGGVSTYQSTWTNALVDNVIRFVSNTDSTRFVNFSVLNTAPSTGLTLRTQQSTSQILNVPNITATDTIVTNDFGATLLNKTLTSPVINGTITGTFIIPAVNGGTGISSFTTGDLLYASTSSALSKLADVVTGNALISGGVGVAPSYGKIGLTTHVTGTLPAVNGGTDNSSYTTGDLLYASTSSALSKLSDIATGNALISGGVGVAPSYGKIGLTTHVSGTLPATNGGTGNSTFVTGDLLYASTSSDLSTLADVATGNALISGGVGVAPSYGKIGLTTHVTGTLPATNGGTGNSTFTIGDLLYASTSSALSKLADVATGNALISGGVGASPSYGKIGLTTHVSGTLPATNGGTDNSSYTIGDLLYASTSSALSKLADVATGNALISGGVGASPSYGKIGLTTHVTGTLPIANGGTNSTTALTNNKIMVSSGGSIVESAALSNGQLLIGSTGAAPVAATLTAGTGISITQGAGSITIDNTSATTIYKVMAYLNASQAVNTTTATIIFNTELIDTNNNYSTVTGLYTVPQNGYYNYACDLTYSTSAQPDVVTINVIVNGVAVTGYSVTNTITTNTSSFNMSNSGLISLTAGQTFGIQATTNKNTSFIANLCKLSITSLL